MVTSSATRPSGALFNANGTVPAFIFVPDPGRAALRIASLTVLDRLVVAAHRGGCGPITIVSAAPLPPLKRARALRIPINVAREAPDASEPALLISAELLVQAADVRRCLQSGARLIDAGGAPLPLGLAAPAHAEVEAMLLGLPELRAEGVALRVENAADAARAEKLLWASLTSASDGLVDKVFNRPCGRPLSKLLIRTPITPNMVSIVSVLIGVAAAGLFAAGEQTLALAGAILFQISAIVDCVDGDIARVVFKESPLGKWIDLVGDQVVHVSIFSGIAFGIYRTEPSNLVLWLGLAAVLGAIVSFAVVLRGMRQAAGQTGPLRRLIDAATNRDFSVLVLALTAARELDLFLWLAAVGSHLFWMAALALQLSVRCSRRA